ncbi:RcnB family protein [Sphingomonas sp. GB1N7]|uniref:RcnB family protein n=1 Tax=Parasphingomonas caseinilytica TaxID=3096158 RepID=UPI002FC99D1C
MRKLIITALIAATAFPAIASAQSDGEIRRDRRDVRQEQRELNNAYRRGDRRDVRDERRDVRDARQELREDVRDRRDDRRDDRRNWGRNDWRGYRDGNRGLYARGNWNAPFRYTAFRSGIRIAPSYYGSRYFIADPWRYRLPNPGWNQRWVRHYNDVLLVDTRRGVVVDVIRNFYW